MKKKYKNRVPGYPIWDEVPDDYQATEGEIVEIKSEYWQDPANGLEKLEQRIDDLEAKMKIIEEKTK